MKHAFSKSAPTGRLEYDGHGYPLAPIEYSDHHDTSDQQQARGIIETLDNNTDRIQRLTDSIIQLFGRIHQ